MNFEVNLENLTQEEQEQFNTLVEKLIEKANKPKSKVWKPEVGETYYNFAATNLIWRNTDIDIFNYAIGNCFKTREEAEFALERLKVIAEMKRYITEHDDVEIDWYNSSQLKYCIYYLYPDDEDGLPENSIGIRSVWSVQEFESALYASSSEILENMIKEISEDRIKKYYFGVGKN